jgi:hypothetical protein
MPRELKRLPRLKGRRKRLPDLDTPKTPPVPKLAPDDLSVWAQRLGSESEARKMIALQQQYPRATLPELVTLDWLMRHGYDFEFQAPLFGGRRAGGTVLDFLVFEGGQAIAWQINGSYWHTLKTVAQRDKQILLRLLGAQASGFRIGKIATIWESDVYTKRPLVFYQALAGISLR